MKNAEIKIGSVYAVKVSGRIVPVRIDAEHYVTYNGRFAGWDATNLSTDREVRIHSGAKCRYELEKNDRGKWAPKLGPRFDLMRGRQ